MTVERYGPRREDVHYRPDSGKHFSTLNEPGSAKPIDVVLTSHADIEQMLDQALRPNQNRVQRWIKVLSGIRL